MSYEFAKYPEELQVERPFITVTKEQSVSNAALQQYQNLIAQAKDNGKLSRTPYAAKSILEIPDLVKQLIDTIQNNEKITTNKRVKFTSDFPDMLQEVEEIVFRIARREPGAFSQGAPFEGKVKNLRPTYRSEEDDEENPGYKRVILGYWYDNIIQFICCAKSSWQAESRAVWLESILGQYDWWLGMQGVTRFMFFGRDRDIKIENNNNKIYGKVVNFFVRTEELTKVSVKTLEELIVQLNVKMC